MITNKFGRKYKLTIRMDGEDEEIIIQNPFTVQFDIQRNTMANLNEGSFFIYNLSENIRNRIFKDYFDPNQYHQVKFDAGYGDQLFNCFTGNIFYSKSGRQGSDIITEIYAKDGGFDTATTMTHKTLKAGTTMSDLSKVLAQDFPNLKIGAVGNIKDVFKRGVSVSGNTYSEMIKYLKNDVYIDSERINILLSDEVLDTGEIPIISPESGLLETPVRENARMHVRTIFWPQILMGQAIELQSTTLKNYNGQYKVVGVTHSGIISEAVNGDCSSRFELLVGGQLFNGFREIQDNG